MKSVQGWVKKGRENNWGGGDIKSSNIPCSCIFIFLIKLPDTKEYSGSSTWKVMTTLNIAATKPYEKASKGRKLVAINTYEIITKLRTNYYVGKTQEKPTITSHEICINLSLHCRLMWE